MTFARANRQLAPPPCGNEVVSANASASGAAFDRVARLSILNKKIPNEKIPSEKEEARPVPSIGASHSLAQVFGASGTEDRARRIGGIHGQIMATFAAKDESLQEGLSF